jgi:hypothetical protein
MPTGTDAPITSDLIERFNALMADVLACVTDAALKAAGVPWPLRLLLGPLVRRRLTRWSGDFSALVADTRAGRLVETAGDRDEDVAGGPSDQDGRRDAVSAPVGVCSARYRTDQADVRGDADDLPNFVVNSERCAAPRRQRGARSRVETGARIGGPGARGRVIASPRCTGETRRVGSPGSFRGRSRFFQGAAGGITCAYFVAIYQ